MLTVRVQRLSGLTTQVTTRRRRTARPPGPAAVRCCLAPAGSAPRPRSLRVEPPAAEQAPLGAVRPLAAPDRAALAPVAVPWRRMGSGRRPRFRSAAARY